MDFIVFQQLGISLGLGLLVGLQRERSDDPLAGIRTFPLITVAGTLAAMLGGEHGGWLLPGALLGLMALVVIGNVAKLREGERSIGITTEVAALVMYLVGALLVLGSTPAAVALGGTIALLLHFKAEVHGLAFRLSETDLRAIMQFVLITLVILPVLPDRTFGPYDVLNPVHIWLMVVLIVGINLGGYLAFKWVGGRAGSLVGGILGGMISSTAATASYAQQSRAHQTSAGLAALAIMLASTVVFARILLEIGVVAPAVLGEVAGPFVGMLAVSVVICAIAYRFVGGGGETTPEARNPARLKAALVFGALYAGVLFVVAAANQHFGDQGLYLVATLSGLTDVDAITLSTAQLVDEGRVQAGIGWRAIMIAALANMVFKAGIVAVLGGHRSFRPVAIMFAATIAAGIGVILLWP